MSDHCPKCGSELGAYEYNLVEEAVICDNCASATTPKYVI